MKTVSQLIEELNQFPPDLPVMVLDWRKNEKEGEMSSEGVHNFQIESMEAHPDEEESKPWLAISFDSKPEVL